MKLDPGDLDRATYADWLQEAGDEGSAQALGLIREIEPGLSMRALYELDEPASRHPGSPLRRYDAWSMVARVAGPSNELDWLHVGEDDDGFLSGVIIDGDRASRGLSPEILDTGIDCYVDGFFAEGTGAGDDWKSGGAVYLDDPLLRSLESGRADVSMAAENLTVDGRYVGSMGSTAIRTTALLISALADYLVSSPHAANIRCLLPCHREPLVAIASARALRLLSGRVLRAFGRSEHDMEIWGLAGLEDSADRNSHQIRLTLSAVAAILGVCDRVIAEPYRSPAGLYRDALRLAVNTLRILRYESLLGTVGDAMSGSLYVESLTEQTVDRAWSIFLAIEARDGLRAVIDSGKLTDILNESEDES